LSSWPCPPLYFVYADRDGAIGYHAAGLVPKRERAGAAFRDPNDPADAWRGFIPFDELPRLHAPGRGWIATANNVPSRRDPWYVATGNWSDGYRARRIREQLTARERLEPEEIAHVQADHVTGRGRELAPALLTHLGEGRDAREVAAIRGLREWRGEQTLDSVGASIWAAFWIEWCLALARARFPAPLVGPAALKVSNVARLLLLGEPLPWLTDDAGDAVRAAFARALDALERAAGPNVTDWQWGTLHQVIHPHPMSATPELAALFNTGPYPTTGGQSVRAAGYNLGVPFAVVSGSTYRFMADLSRPDALVAVQTLGQSGHLGSPHYRDQTALWLEDRYHPFWMDETDVLANLEAETVIRPE
jgi:penicillin amidase